MVQLHFDVQMEMIMQQKYVQPADIVSKTNRGFPKQVAVCCWIGGDDNQELAYVPLNTQTNTAEIKINVSNNNVDTLKLASILETNTSRGTRPYMMASFFLPINTLCDTLESKNTDKFFSFRSNFDPNACIVRLSNISTDTTALRSLQLRPSSLNKISEMNEMIGGISTKLQEHVSELGLSADIGATQFVPVNTNTFLPMANVQSSYAVIPQLFNVMKQSKNNPVSLGWLMYDMYMALHHTHLHPITLQSMCDKDLILYFALPMIQNRCNCALASPYNEDLAPNSSGKMEIPTEEIGLTFSELAYVAQQQEPYVPKTIPKLTIQEAYEKLIEHRSKNIQPLFPDSEEPYIQRKSMAAVLDDCENGALGFCIQQAALGKMYSELESKDTNTLVQKMTNVSTNELPHLFKNITVDDHEQMAPVLLRLGKLVYEQKWNTGMTVVTARNKAMDDKDTEGGGGLAGHGVCMSQLIKPDKTYEYMANEATTCMKLLPSRRSLQRTSDLRCKMADKSIATMNIAKWATLFLQSAFPVVSISPHTCIQANLSEPNEYEESEWKKSPFYVGAFYCGFDMHNNSIGSIPTTVTLNNTMNFGAPVINLSKNATMALPIYPPCDVKKFNSLLYDIGSEAWPPFASKNQVQKMMSWWAPIQTVPYAKLMKPTQSKNYITTQISSAFDSPALREVGVKVYQTLAARFNDLQTAEGMNDDGHRMYAHSNYHSAVLTFLLKLPPDGTVMKASAMKNLRQAATDIRLQEVLRCPLKKHMMQNRMQAKSTEPFYKCEITRQIVHAFSEKIL